MRCFLISLSLVFAAVLASTADAAEGLPSFEVAARKIQAATVTVRIRTADANANAERPDSDETEPKKNSPRVTVFSGISLGDGLLVTPLFTDTAARIRITVSGGQQAEAIPLVFDEYSGLTLLRIDRQDVPGLPLAKDSPKVGSWLMSAAAWGVEKPVVSLGIVSGVDRQIRGANYPPLLQCDLRTAETSSGAGVVNQQGHLLGVVVAKEGQQEDRGWTYAVPVRHVQRLLRAQDGKSKKDKNEKLILQKRRPVVGMVLDGQPDHVVVQRVTKGSPAEKAGIKPGDQILEADGAKIRAVYQAVRPVLYKQPGDKVTYLVKQQDAIRPVEVVLGGGVVLPGAPGINLANIFQPKVIVGGQGIAAVPLPRRDRGQVFAEQPFGGDKRPDKQVDPLQLLQKALDSYRTVIVNQQRQIENLQAEIEALKTRMGDPAPADRDR